MSTYEYLNAIVEELPKRARLPMWWSATSMEDAYWLRGVGCGAEWDWRGQSHPTGSWPMGADLTSAILIACWDVMIAGGFTVEERRDALGRLDARLRARDEGRICVECGTWDVYVEQGRKRWNEDRLVAMAARKVCFTCSHWCQVMGQAASPHGDPVVVSQSWTVYTVGRENASSHGFRGFGGAKFILEFLDGRTLRSSTLWCAGTLPEHFRARFPQNARVKACETSGDGTLVDARLSPQGREDAGQDGARMRRSQGERERLRHSITRLRTTLDSLETGLKMGGPVGNEAIGALVTGALEVSLQVAKLDAFELVEHDQLELAALVEQLQ